MMPPDMVISLVVGTFSAIFWYWIKNIDKKQDEDKARMDKIEAEFRAETQKIRSEYQRRDDAKREYNNVLQLLRDIRSDVRDLSHKLDKKADK